jgi:hypothetical protein
METLDKILTEEQATEVAKKILSKTCKKLIDEINSVFYSETESYLYEIYTNLKSKIETELIDDVTERFIKDPMHYKYYELRKKIFNENKEEILKPLTDDAIIQTMENILLQYTHRENYFNWQWKDGIVKLILENWDKFKDDERINENFGRKLKQLQDQNMKLTNQLNELMNYNNNSE